MRRAPGARSERPSAAQAFGIRSKTESLEELGLELLWVWGFEGLVGLEGSEGFEGIRARAFVGLGFRGFSGFRGLRGVFEGFVSTVWGIFRLAVFEEVSLEGSM